MSLEHIPIIRAGGGGHRGMQGAFLGAEGLEARRVHASGQEIEDLEACRVCASRKGAEGSRHGGCVPHDGVQRASRHAGHVPRGRACVSGRGRSASRHVGRVSRDG